MIQEPEATSIPLGTPGSSTSNRANEEMEKSIDGYVNEVSGSLHLPKGWKYATAKVFGHPIWYASPKVQLLMVSFVCFLCPGMFNALGGMGGGGRADAKLADDMVCISFHLSVYQLLVLRSFPEHCALLHLRCVWFRWWTHCQPLWC